MATIYVIEGFCSNLSFDGMDMSWVVQFSFYDKEEAAAHITEINEEIRTIWRSHVDEVEWSEKRTEWRTYYYHDFHPPIWWTHKLDGLDPHLIGWQDFASFTDFPQYRIVETTTKGSP